MILGHLFRNPAIFLVFLFIIPSYSFSQDQTSNFLEQLLEEHAIPGLSIAILKDGKVDFLPLLVK